MLGKNSVRWASLAVVMAALSPAEAAVLTANGVVMVNRGNGFQVVQGATEVNPGDSVLVNEGSAQLTYPDGTTASLEPGQLHSVAEAPPAGTPGTPPAEVVTSTGGATTGGLTTTTMIVGGVAIVGGIGLAVSASKPSEKKSSPSSP